MQLTSKQLIKLSSTIPVQEMIKIGEGYLNLEPAVIQNIVFDNRHSQAITREILRAWSFKNQSSDQTEVSAYMVFYFNSYSVFFVAKWLSFYEEFTFYNV